MSSVGSSPGPDRSEEGVNAVGCMRCLQQMFGDPLRLNHVCDRSWNEGDGQYTVCGYCNGMGKKCADVGLSFPIITSLADSLGSLDFVWRRH